MNGTQACPQLVVPHTPQEGVRELPQQQEVGGMVGYRVDPLVVGDGHMEKG